MQRTRRDPWRGVQEDLERLEAQEPPQEDSLERIPCPDESCVGSLGENGRCRLCGAWGGGDCPAQVGDPPMGVEPEKGSVEDAQWEDETVWEERVPCADESCVGSVDEDGYCRICGLRWKEGGYNEGEPLEYREEGS